VQIIVTVLLLLPSGVIPARSASAVGALVLLEQAKSGPGGLLVRGGCADLALRDTERHSVLRCVPCHASQQGCAGAAGRNTVREYPDCAGVLEVDAISEQCLCT